MRGERVSGAGLSVVLCLLYWSVLVELDLGLTPKLLIYGSVHFTNLSYVSKLCVVTEKTT